MGGLVRPFSGTRMGRGFGGRHELKSTWRPQYVLRGITILVVGSVEARMLMCGSLVQPRPPKLEALQLIYCSPATAARIWSKITVDLRREQLSSKSYEQIDISLAVIFPNMENYLVLLRILTPRSPPPAPGHRQMTNLAASGLSLA
jgi:hypothetical protein